MCVRVSGAGVDEAWMAEPEKVSDYIQLCVSNGNVQWRPVLVILSVEQCGQPTLRCQTVPHLTDLSHLIIGHLVDTAC